MALVKQADSAKPRCYMNNLQEYLDLQLDAFVNYQNNRKHQTNVKEDRRKKLPSKTCKLSGKDSKETKSSRSATKSTKNEYAIQDIFKKYRPTEGKPSKDQKKLTHTSDDSETIKDILEKYRNGRKSNAVSNKPSFKALSDTARGRIYSEPDRGSSKTRNPKDIVTKNKKRSKSADFSKSPLHHLSTVDSTSDILRCLGVYTSHSDNPKPINKSPSSRTYTKEVRTKDSDTGNRESRNSDVKIKPATYSDEPNCKVTMISNNMERRDSLTYRSYLSIGSIGSVPSHNPVSAVQDEDDKENESESKNSDAARRRQLEKRLKENGKRFQDLNGAKKCNDLKSKRTQIDQLGQRSHENSHDASVKPCIVQVENKNALLWEDELTNHIQEDLEKWRGRRRERMKERPNFHRSRSEGAYDSGPIASDCVSGLVDIDVYSERIYRSEMEVEEDIRELQEKLKRCTDFGDRRTIRGTIRKLRERKSAIEIGSGSGGTPGNTPAGNCREVTPAVKDIAKDFLQVGDITELRKLLSETSDYDEKKQIRLALRQLRQRNKEREGGRDSGLVNGRGLARSQSFVNQYNANTKTADVIRESGDKPKIYRSSSFLEAKSRLKTEQDSVKDSCTVDDNDYATRRISDVTSDCSVISETSSRKSSSHQSDLSIDTTDKRLSRDTDSYVESKPPVVPNGYHKSSDSFQSNLLDSSPLKRHSGEKNSHSNLQPLSFSSSHLVRKSSSSDNSDLCQNRPPSSPSSRRSHSVVEANSGSPFPITSKSNDKGISQQELDAKKWLDSKKRSSSLPGIDHSLSAMEAAFSELLSAVDDKADNVSDNDTDDIDLIAEDSEEALRSITSPEEACHIVSDTSGKSSPVETRSTLVHESSNTKKLKVSVAGEDFTSEDQKEDVGVICTTPQRTLDRPLLDLTRSPPDNTSAISVIEDDDGSVTVQSVSYSDKGNHTVTEKTRLRRTESRTEEEEKDTIIESKITSPGGSDHYTKDVINTRRKVTSRGSDYFTRSAYNIRKRRDFEGDEIEEQDLNVETENFSVSKGECWGDRAEAKVQVRRTANNSPSVIPEGHGTGVEGRSVGNGVTHGRMDISKTSSGYGSVSGSDEEEKEEVPRRGRQAGCPEIKSTLKDVITQDGSTAVLECTVSGSPLPSIVWYKGNKPISTTKHYEPKFDTLTGKASLTVLNATQDYGGEYRCVFRNPLGEAETKSRLTVRSRALKKPSISISLKDQTVTEGQAVCLECKVTDATQIAWYKDGIIQRNSSDFKQTFDGTFAKLEIGEIFLDDTGEYSCIAKNEKGEAKTMCKIRVKEDTGDGDVVPMFLTKPESKIYSSGETIILECDVIGSPKPQITWHRDKQRVGNNSKHRTLYDGRVATLRISQTSPDDSGKYEVVAENCAGKVSVDALIVVKAKQGPPSILHSLADATAKVGKPLILHCDIRGSPVPMILWRKDGRMIGNTADFKQTYENNMARLEINDVYEQDGGCYECVARNSFGAVSSSCKIIIEGKKPPGETTNKKTDWLVGRDQSNPEDSISKPNEVSKLKGSGVKRSESVKVTSNYPVRDRFRRNLNVQDDQQGAITTQNNEKSNTSHSSPSQQTDSNISQRSTLQKTDSKTKIVKDDVQPAKPVGKEDPPWKNVTLRRTESAKMPNYGRSKPLTWKRDEQSETESKDVSNTNEGKPASSGWRPVFMELKTDFPKPKTEVDKLKTNTQIGLRRSESARALNSNRDIVAKFLTGALEREKDTDRNDELSSDKSQSVRAIHRIKDEEISSKPSYSNQDSDTVEENNNVSDKKLSRSQSMRLLFERKSGKNLPEQDEQQTTVSKSVPSYLARRDAGVRRTSSLKITEKEAGALRSKRQENGVHLDLAPLGKESEDSFTSRRRVWETTPSTQSMPSYDTIDDEEELHKMLSKTENFEERKKIRSRMKEIREKKQQEWESKRAEREKDAGDAVRRKFELAEQEKQRKMKAFDKMAEETSKDRARIQAKSEELLQDKLRHADQEKKRHLQQFDELAKHDEKKTVSKTPGGGTRTIVVKDSQTTSGFGGISYGKSTTEQAANFLTNQLIGAVSPGTSGKITVKTESWSSRDGITNKSEKTESWGAKPSGTQGAKAMFKQMDASSPAPKANLAPAGRGGGGGRALMRSPSAIKQMLLEWTKAMTKEYQEYGVEITNFSSSWNNGMAFCALIHHFYPDSFDFSQLDPKKRRANFVLAFDTAEKVADIAPLLDVEDMVRMQKPDWKCVFTYVQSFYRKLHTHERNSAAKPAES